MTARSKVTLVEAQQIRAKLVEALRPYLVSEIDKKFSDEVAVDVLMALGLIDTDAALRLVTSDE